MAKFCTNCGKEIDDNANVCPSCGTMVDGAPAGTTVVVNNVQAQSKGNGFAIYGFVISLVSTLLCCGSFNMISLILSIVGVMKSKELGGTGKGLSIAGIIISALGLLCLIALSAFFYIVAAAGEASYYYGY